jgi:hypothetical protein
MAIMDESQLESDDEMGDDDDKENSDDSKIFREHCKLSLGSYQIISEKNLTYDVGADGCKVMTIAHMSFWVS